MKKLVLAVLMSAWGASASFAADPTWIKASLYDKTAYPVVNAVHGLELGLVYSNTPQIAGVQFTLVCSRSLDIQGVQFGVASVGDKVQGVQWSVVNLNKELNGVQLGLINNGETAQGLQWGLININSNMNGVQLGWVNYSKTFQGFQLGFVNYVDKMTSGLQVGVLNIITESKLPFMVIANARF